MNVMLGMTCRIVLRRSPGLTYLSGSMSGNTAPSVVKPPEGLAERASDIVKFRSDGVVRKKGRGR
jgi:hypothetical protein